MPQDKGVIKAAVFDADNTLYELHTKKAYEKMFAYVAGKTRSDAKTVEAIWRGHINNILNSKDAKSAEKRRREYSLEIVLGQLGVIEPKGVSRIIGESLGIFWKQTLGDLKYKKSDISAISKLKDKIPLAVASDEYRSNLEPKLNAVFGDWKKYFRFLVTADETGELKPSEKYSLLSIKKFGLKPADVLFTGDSWRRDLEPAKLCGLKTMLVGENREGEPDFWVKNISQAVKILEPLSLGAERRNNITLNS